tara:strand:+ start:323 stop:640 length:318 start_codon:yes stop_codon:yes gene_type:complete
MTGIADAILSLKSDAQVSVEAEDIAKITWHDGNPTDITTEQIQAEQVTLQAAYDALDYARLRADSYPSLSEFVEAYTEREIGNDSAKWNAYVISYNAVRSDNPKA